ncbi:MAG TPA: thioredoxin domain-containing protein [Clostridia bacterium]|nr:thioredoxin domain-containing protein [Clostridia bacterium]
MKNSTAQENKKNLALKIIIPVLLVAIVTGIFGVKKLQEKREVNDNGSVAQGETNGNPDFAYAVTGEFDIEKLKSYRLPIVIEFGADWCGPCKQMKPILTALNKELLGKAIVRTIDTDKYGSQLSEYNFQYIPTQIFINADGTPYNPPNAAEMQMDLHYDSVTKELSYTTHTGVLSKQALLDILKEMGMK